MEQDLVTYITTMEEMLFGLTVNNIRILAYQMATQNGLSHEFSSDKDKVGRDWLNGFLSRHPEIVL